MGIETAGGGAGSGSAAVRFGVVWNCLGFLVLLLRPPGSLIFRLFRRPRLLKDDTVTVPGRARILLPLDEAALFERAESIADGSLA